MKKLVSLLIALVLSVFSAVSVTADNPIDTPVETKTVEWAIAYHARCVKYGKVSNYGKRMSKFAKNVALAPLRLFLGTAVAETTANERYWSCLAQGGTHEEATVAYNAADDSEVKKPKSKRATHPKWAKVDPKRVGFLSAESLEDVTSAKRGWFTAAELNGFDNETVLAYKWYKPEDPEPLTEAPKEITFRGKKYMLWCASQMGVKKGIGVYLTRKFLYAETDGVKNHILLDAPDGLPINKVNQVRALRFTACEPTEATMKQVIVFMAKRRTDKVSDIVDGRPVKHVDVPNGYAITDATEVEQALADGGCIIGPKAGIKAPAAQLRNKKGMKCAGIKYRSKYIGKTVLDAFGCQVVVTEESILSTTDNHKDVKPFLKKIKDGKMTPEQAKAAWLEAQGGPDALIYSCPVHPQTGRIQLGRQLFGKFSQIKADALFKIVSKDLGKLAELGFESGYKKSLQRKYAALRIPALANALNHPLLYKDTVREYLSRWHKIASGGVEVNGSLAIAVIDPAWFDDVYVGGKSVDDPTAGIVAAGTILFGTPNKDGVNPYIGKRVVLGRFPQVKSGLPVVTVAAGSYASGVVVVSGRPGDMVLQDLDADLDGDKFYVIDEEDIVEAVEKANKLFNFPHIIFSKWEETPTDETLEQYLGRNAKWQSEESVGVFATHQFVIDEMVPLLEDNEDWEKLLRPTLDKDGNYSEFVTLKEIFILNILLGVAGNMATDSGKLNHKPDAPEYITKKVAFRPISQRDAHPNAPDSGFKKRHAAFLPDKYPGVGTNVVKRLYDLLMKFVPIEEVGRDEVNDFSYDENGRILPDRPLTLWCPSEFEPIGENVWKHTFGNELDQIKTSLVCYPNEAETVELNADLQVFSEAEEGISLVTYFAKYATRIVAIETDLNNDKKGWTVAGRDTFGDNLIRFVKTATKRKDISDEDCLWLAYNALCQSLIGTQSQSRGTAYAINQFLKLFEGMLIEQVCKNTGSKPPKLFEKKISIKDSVTKTTTEETETIETTAEEPPFDLNMNSMELQQRLTAELGKTDEVEPTESVNVSDLLAQLQSDTATEEENETEETTEDWSINIDPEDYDED